MSSDLKVKSKQLQGVALLLRLFLNFSASKPPMTQPYQLLFVCLGNICRSPSAENIMNHLIRQRGLQDKITCDSAGTASYHVGSAPDRRMAAAAAQRGIKLVGQARQFQPADFEQFDLILAMDQANYEDHFAGLPCEPTRPQSQTDV